MIITTRSARIGLLMLALFAGRAMAATSAAEASGQHERGAESSPAAGIGWLLALQEADYGCHALLEPDEYGPELFLELNRRDAAYMEDIWLTARVKARLLLDDPSTGLAIAVTSHAGLVHISGRLGAASEFSRVVGLASRVEGVRAVYAALALAD